MAERSRGYEQSEEAVGGPDHFPAVDRALKRRYSTVPLTSVVLIGPVPQRKMGAA